MAHLEVMGEFQGPGEERTATRLAAELPAGWYVIAGRKLSGESRDDLDLVVVGDRAVFVLEERFWGPRLELHDQYWRVGGDERRSPLDRVNHLARALAGRMRTSVPGYIEASRTAHLVVAGVVLSNPAVEVTVGADFEDDDCLHTLDGASGWLRSRDAATRGNLAGARAAVLTFLLGLQQRDDRIERLGPYTIDDELSRVEDRRRVPARPWRPGSQPRHSSSTSVSPTFPPPTTPRPAGFACAPILSNGATWCETIGGDG